MRSLPLLGYSSVNELVPSVQAAYLSKKLQAARADFTAADEARRALAQRDREAAAAMADTHRDMAGHVVRRRLRRLPSACSDMHGICNDGIMTWRPPLQLATPKPHGVQCSMSIISKWL